MGKESGVGGMSGIVKGELVYLLVVVLLLVGCGVLGVVGLKVEMGFRIFKWKVGVGDIGDELLLFDDLIVKLLNGLKLWFDVNGVWDWWKVECWLEWCVDWLVEFVE